jgi:hypothetical protein
LTEQEIAAIKIGDALPRIKIGFSEPLEACPYPYEVEGLPEGIGATISKTEADNWIFSVRGTPPGGAFEKPLLKPPSPGDIFQSQDAALDGLKAYLRAHIMKTPPVPVLIKR